VNYLKAKEKQEGHLTDAPEREAKKEQMQSTLGYRLHKGGLIRT
jgi:hypothetical protein